MRKRYRIADNFRGDKIFVVGALTTNLLPTNKVTLPTVFCKLLVIVHSKWALSIVLLWLTMNVSIQQKKKFKSAS